MKRLVIGAVLIAMLAVSTGTGCQAIRYQQIRNSVQSRGVEVTGAEVRWTLLIPSGVVLHLNAIIWNGSDYPLEIERALYTVYVGGREAGENTVYDIQLPPQTLTYIPVSIDMSIVDLGQWVWEYLTGGIEIRVVGTVEIPLRIWGLRIGSVPIGFDESTYYRLGQS
jgi:LEA14-like dessication related protein